MSGADRSNIEIKILLKNLDPTKGAQKHKDRLRRLNKFRNYVTAKPPPEFYDDDYSLLLLGSESPTAMEDEDLGNMILYGLLRASGCPSTDHKDALKRSARPAISLLRYLCLEFDQPGSKANNLLGELNGFASELCALNVPQLRTMRLDIHIGKGDNESGSRGGSKDDACNILALILARHTDTDYETPKPLKVQDLLPAAASQAEFEAWLGQNATPDIRRAIKESKGKADGKTGSGGRSAKRSSFGDAAGTSGLSDDDAEDGDMLGVFGKKTGGGGGSTGKVSGSGGGKGGRSSAAEVMSLPMGDEKPTRWSDSPLATDTRERQSGAIFLEEEREKAIAERKKAEEEKQRLLGRDPLGIRGTDTFDLRTVDSQRDSLIQHALQDIDEEIDAEINTGGGGEDVVERVNQLEAQRQALLAIVEKKKSKKNASIEEGSNGNDSQELPSIVPTNSDFDPMLFLTLVHRNASYKQLQDSTSRLSRKTDTQVERLQSLVRDNFELFIKCSEGIDVFAERQEDNENRKSNPSQQGGMQQLQQHFRTLDALAESCSDQARKSFKPLLDNTNQVRKVQSALAVLQRVAPLLQVPSLMRQHIENGSFSSVVKVYRKVLVIEKNCNVELLNYVRVKAGEAAMDARHDLELILADESCAASNLLDAIRDMGELLELLEEDEDRFGEKSDSNSSGGSTPRSSGNNNAGTFTIDRHIIRVRDHPPALACLLLQCTHFRSLVEKAIAHAESTTERIFRGEGPEGILNSGGSNNSEEKNKDDLFSSSSGLNTSIDGSSYSETNTSSQRSRDKRWKYETLEARVLATARAVTLAKNWLPRLLQIGMAAQEAEKRRVARRVRRRTATNNDGNDSTADSTEDKDASGEALSAYDMYNSIVNPAVTSLVEHVAYCALGCANQGSKYRIVQTFGKSSSERLRTLLKSPLPPTHTAKCALELAELAEAIQETNDAMSSNREVEVVKEGSTQPTPLEGCFKLANDAVVMIERRVCIYSFDACSRSCSLRASGSGILDGDALLQCVQKLSEDLTRPEECSKEVEKGCLLVVRKCCEGLTSYVKDRSDAARLRVVAECADALSNTIVDVVREVSFLINDQSESLEANLSAVISSLEGDMFDVFLENVKRNVCSGARLGFIEAEESYKDKKAEEISTFPPYLAASFLSIVRCRAQVERALRETTVRRSEGTTYQFLALRTACDGVVESICQDMKAKLNDIPSSKADGYATHLQFLISTLKKYLSDDILSIASDTKRMLASKAGSGVGRRGVGNGPEGLTALENLERLGRVYILCLSE